MNKKQQKHELFITFASHVQGSAKRHKPAPVKKKKKAVRQSVSLTLRYQQMVSAVMERVQLQVQQIGQLFYAWKVRH